MRGSHVLVVLGVGSLAQAGSGWWDVFSHRIEFVEFDPWWSPAHTGLYTGTALISMAALIAARRGVEYSFMRVIKAMVYVQLVAGVSNELIHRAPALERVLDLAVHSAFTLGMLGVAAALFSGLSLEASRSGGMEGASLLALTMSGGSLWLISSGSVIYLLGRYPATTIALLAFVSSTIVITTISALRARGSSIPPWIFYASTIYLVLVGYVGVSPYLPTGLFSVMATEAVFRTVASRAGYMLGATSGGAVLGTLYHLTYYPLSEHLTTALGPYEALLSASLGGLSGGFLIAVAARLIATRHGIGAPMTVLRGSLAVREG